MTLDILLQNFLLTGALIWGIVTIVFLLALLKRDNSIMDIAYGPTFFLSLLGAALITDTSSLLAILIIACVGLWSARLSSRICKKNWGKPEDARYAAWREEWNQRGRWYFLLRSYGQIYLLQGFIILLVASPGILALSATSGYSVPFLIAGALVFGFGLLYETIADWQLDRFIAGKKAGTESADLMTRGLFHYSRRPNYFGETLVWWGLAIMVLPLPFGYLALVSPLVITYIVTAVTGPMLERMFLEKYPEQYQRYIDTTSYLIPWPPRPYEST